jgi:UDP-N-acetylglucosamine 1-carboxyvinyltransferase
MDKIRVVGGQKLKGEVNIAGAKNAVLPEMAASVLTEEELILKNVPQVKDVSTMVKLLSSMGADCNKNSTDSYSIKATRIESIQAPYNLVKTMRASVLVLGPLLARYGEASVSLPGGCAIGARPINLHIEGLKRLGADINIEHGYINASCGRLKGAEYYFDIRSVTGTENIMMAACLAKGHTVLKNCAQEPEVKDLAILLNKMGARIRGAGTDTIMIEGVESLRGAEHSVVPDRIEAGTYAVAGAITAGNVTIKNSCPEHIVALLDKLKRAGVEIARKKRELNINRDKALKAVDIKTLPYPGFPTDMQAQFMALMTRAEGTSVITESIFENRLMHISELQRMGANIKIDGHSAIIEGPSVLSGAHVMATDLRASASLILAGLVANGETIVHRVYHLDRGYENLVQKLQKLGANIQRFE